MKKTITKMLCRSLVMGCVMAMSLFGTSVAQATGSQVNDSSDIGILMYPCVVQNGVVVCPPPLS
ncbi:hypothetical protein [Dyella sp. 2HG41-7]|uniref:hypothetical protein n=1 Tax=Dyella sp. 2HG41-7 TaxID=2883239 RepID=UPI001F2CC17D|nr:hypothetical protein [Dyella sp. 2HG41-7]